MARSFLRFIAFQQRFPQQMLSPKIPCITKEVVFSPLSIDFREELVVHPLALFFAERRPTHPPNHRHRRSKCLDSGIWGPTSAALTTPSSFLCFLPFFQRSADEMWLVATSCRHASFLPPHRDIARAPPSSHPPCFAIDEGFCVFFPLCRSSLGNSSLKILRRDANPPLPHTLPHLRRKRGRIPP